MKQYHVALAGATGAVGAEFLKLLEERDFPLASLTLLASARSVGKTITFKGEELPVTELTEDSFKGCDIAFFSAGGGRSKQVRPSGGQSRSGGDRQLIGVSHGPRGPVDRS